MNHERGSLSLFEPSASGACWEGKDQRRSIWLMLLHCTLLEHEAYLNFLDFTTPQNVSCSFTLYKSKLMSLNVNFDSGYKTILDACDCVGK